MNKVLDADPAVDTLQPATLSQEPSESALVVKERFVRPKKQWPRSIMQGMLETRLALNAKDDLKPAGPTSALWPPDVEMGWYAGRTPDAALLHDPLPRIHRASQGLLRSRQIMTTGLLPDNVLHTTTTHVHGAPPRILMGAPQPSLPTTDAFALPPRRWPKQLSSGDVAGRLTFW